MNVLTFMDITANQGRELFVYITAFVIETAMCLYMLILYRRKYEFFKSTIDPVTQ